MAYTLSSETSLTKINTVTQAFSWMFVGLLLTALASFIVASSQTLITLIFSNSIIFFGLLILELVLVFFLSWRVTKISFAMAVVSFIGYSLLNGVTLSVIFLVYTATSIGSTFLITAGVFGIMALYGYTTKRDLTTVGNLAFMGLIGIILASVVNIFLRNDVFGFILSLIAIAIFIGLTAYDTQKIKQMESEVGVQNLGILGALMLYLDFINIFLNLLRIFGRQRD